MEGSDKLVLLAQVNTSNYTSTEATFAGLFILLFVVVVGGGVFAAWFIIKHAIAFFDSNRRTDIKRTEALQQQLRETSEFFADMTIFQERITVALERMEHNNGLQSERIQEVDTKVGVVDKLVENYAKNTDEGLKDVNRKVDVLDDKVDKLNERFTSLTKDVEIIGLKVEHGDKVRPLKGGESGWQRNVN